MSRVSPRHLCGATGPRNKAGDGTRTHDILLGKHLAFWEPTTLEKTAVPAHFPSKQEFILYDEIITCGRGIQHFSPPRPALHWRSRPVAGSGEPSRDYSSLRRSVRAWSDCALLILRTCGVGH